MVRGGYVGRKRWMMHCKNNITPCSSKTKDTRGKQRNRETVLGKIRRTKGVNEQGYRYICCVSPSSEWTTIHRTEGQYGMSYDVAFSSLSNGCPGPLPYSPVGMPSSSSINPRQLSASISEYLTRSCDQSWFHRET